MEYDVAYNEELLNPRGALLHHETLAKRPDPKSVKLLKKHGIIYKPGRFTPEEDDIIRQNWENYRKLNDLQEDKVDFFLPRGVETVDRQEKWTIIERTLFYPFLCKGLDHRFGQQVGLRFFKLFDPAVRKGYRKITYVKNVSIANQDHRESIINLRLNKNKSYYAIADKYHATITEVRNVITNYMADQKNVPSRTYKRLLKFVESVAGEPLITEIFGYCAADNLNAAFSKSNTIEFSAVSTKFTKTVEAVKENWFFILKVMHKLCQYWKSVGDSEEEALKKSRKCIFTRRKPKLTNAQFASFIKITLSQLSSKSVYTGSFSSLFNKDKLENSCIDERIFLFRCNQNAVSYLLQLLAGILYAIRKVFKAVSSELTLRDQLLILYNYYDNISDLIEGTDPNDKRSAVYRNPFLDSLAILLSDEHEDATVPGKWKKYGSVVLMGDSDTEEARQDFRIAKNVLVARSLILTMPEEGVLDANGFLFHHTALEDLKTHHKLRLLEYGIKYVENKRFTREEDDRIRRNWKKFANRHGYRYEDGLYYANHWVRCKSRNFHLYYEEQSALLDLNMYPVICKYLENRSAAQVMRRMTTIFDRYYMGLPNPLTDGEILHVYTLYSKNRTLSQIANELKRPYSSIHSMLSIKKKEWQRLGYKPEDVIENPELMQNRLIKPYQRRRFFLAVLKKLGMSVGSFGDDLITSLSTEKIEKSSETVNFVDLIPSFGGFTEENLKNTWKTICADLLESCKKYLEESPEESDSAWIRSMDEVLPCFERSAENYVVFLRALQRYTDENASVLKVTNVNTRKLGKKLYKKGIINDRDSFVLNEYPGYKKIILMLNSKEKFLFVSLELPLTLREKLEIFIRCFEKVESKQDLLHFPAITNTLFVETTIEVIRETNEDWYPPKCLQVWVRSAALVDLFRRSSYTTQLSNNLKDIIAFRQMTMTDEKQLTSLSKSGGVAAGFTRMIPMRTEGALSAPKKKPVVLNRKRGWQETSLELSCKPQPSNSNSLSTPHPPLPQETSLLQTPYMNLTCTPLPPRLENTSTPLPQRLENSSTLLPVLDIAPTPQKPAQLSFCDSEVVSPNPKRLNLNPIAIQSFTQNDTSRLSPNGQDSVGSSGNDDASEVSSVAKDLGLIHIPKFIPKEPSPELEATGWDSIF